MEIITIIAGDSPEEEYYVIVEDDDESDQEEDIIKITIDEEIIIDDFDEIIIDETEDLKEIVGFEEIQCPYCFEWFLEESQLMEHLKSHVGVPELFCIFCERSYQPSYFSRHLKRHFTKRLWTFDDNGRKVCTYLDATGQNSDREVKPKSCKCCEKAKRKRVLWRQSRKTLKLPDPALWETPICIDPLDGSLC